MRHLCLFALLVVGTALAADPLDEARTARQQGDYAAALQLLEPLAEAGIPQAQMELASMYHAGQGVAVDDETAVKWYRSAADQDYAPAQRRLGDLYRDGEGVVQNDKEAVRWYRRAARRGDADAQFALGEYYDKGGQGIPQNSVRAHMWLNLAGSSYVNQDRAFQTHQIRDRLSMRMTPEEVARAEQMASECLKNRYKGCK